MSDSPLSTSRGSSTRNSFRLCVDLSPSKGSLDSETYDEVELSRSRRFSTTGELLQEDNSILKNPSRIHEDESELFETKEYSESDISCSISESSESFDEPPPQTFSPLNKLPLLPKDRVPYDFSDVRVYYCSEELDVDNVDDYDDEDNLKTLRHFSSSNGGFLNPKIIQNLKEKEIDFDRLLPAQYYICKVLFTKCLEPRCLADIVTFSPTGTGKTFAYLIPMVQFALERKERNDPRSGSPIAMIFVPHQPLAEMVKQKLDQVTKGTGIKTAIFTRGCTVSSGIDFEIAVCTLGTYTKLFSRSLESLKDLEYLVIDEADVMLQEFSYFNQFKELRNHLKCRALLFSATSNNYMKGFIDLSNCFYIECGELNTIAKNVTQNFIEIDTERKSSLYGIASDNPILKYFEGPANPFDALFLILKALPRPLKTVIFCKRKSTAEFLAHKLILIGANAAAIHGTFGSQMRNNILEGYSQGKIDILVATRLITRGIDLDVNTVINYDLPLEVTEYIHRVGRCGRNGASGVTYTFLDFNNRVDYMPSVIKAIALQVNNMVTKDNNRQSIPEFFARRMDGFIADELRKRNLYLQRIQQDQDSEEEDNG